MANFDDVTVSGLLTAFLMQGSLQAQGAALATDPTAVALGAGANHDVVLPQFGAPGLCCYAMTTAGSGETLGGIVTPEVTDGQLVAIINVSANTIETIANDASSAVGNRFSLAVNIVAGAAALFIRRGALWYPLFTGTGS
jgi:hypothetical protein